jgi:hypothetical protein
VCFCVCVLLLQFNFVRRLISDEKKQLLYCDAKATDWKPSCQFSVLRGVTSEIRFVCQMHLCLQNSENLVALRSELMAASGCRPCCQLCCFGCANPIFCLLRFSVAKEKKKNARTVLELSLSDKKWKDHGQNLLGKPRISVGSSKHVVLLDSSGDILNGGDGAAPCVPPMPVSCFLL